METRNCNCQYLEKRLLILEKEVMHLKKAMQYQSHKKYKNNK